MHSSVHESKRAAVVQRVSKVEDGVASHHRQDDQDEGKEGIHCSTVEKPLPGVPVCTRWERKGCVVHHLPEIL